MRLCRFGENRLGMVQGEHVFDVTAVLGDLPAHRYPLPRTDPLIEHLDLQRRAERRGARVTHGNERGKRG